MACIPVVALTCWVKEPPVAIIFFENASNVLFEFIDPVGSAPSEVYPLVIEVSPVLPANVFTNRPFTPGDILGE